MFLGRYEHSIDEKGRLTIPARFRELLSEGAYLTLGFDRNLLALTPTAFEQISQRVKQMSLTDGDARLLRRIIFSNAEKVEVDRAGRILIPQWLRQTVGIDGSAVIVGVGDYFEIWAPDQWKTQDERLKDSEANQQRFVGLDLPVY